MSHPGRETALTPPRVRREVSPERRRTLNTAAASQSGNYRFDINSEPREEGGRGKKAQHFEEAKWAITDK